MPIFHCLLYVRLGQLAADGLLSLGQPIQFASSALVLRCAVIYDLTSAMLPELVDEVNYPRHKAKPSRGFGLLEFNTVA